MADSSIDVTAGSGTSIDTRTESTNSNHRQVVVIGDPSTNAGVAPVDATTGLVVRPAQGVFNVSVDITRPANTTAYAAADAISDSTTAPTSGGFTFSSVARVSGGSVLLTDLKCASSNNAGGLNGEVVLFNTSVTNIDDNAAWVVSDSEIKTCVGKIPFYLEGVGNNSFYHATRLSIVALCSGSANLRFLVRVRSAYTPISAEVFTFVLSGLQID